MNFLNFFLPHGFKSREDGRAVQLASGVSTTAGLPPPLRQRLWAHRWSLWRNRQTSAETIAAARYFSANKGTTGAGLAGIQTASASAGGLIPFLSPELQVDNIVAMSPFRLSRRDVMKSIVPQIGARQRLLSAAGAVGGIIFGPCLVRWSREYGRHFSCLPL